MEKRTMNVTAGDWSDDGHGKIKTVTYLLEGEDVSNEKLSENFIKNCAKTGHNPLDYCSEYEDSSFPGAFFDGLTRLGLEVKEKMFPYVKDDISIYSLCFDDNDEEIEIYTPLSKILELYLEVKITVIPPPETLIGGYDGLLKKNGNYGTSSFGYGLFF